MSSVTLDVAVGKPHEEIASTAERLNCDVIVMGAHGRTGANKMMLGSTTHRILRRSPLPVLATPPVTGRARGPAKGWPGKMVLAPVDIGIRDRADALAAAVVARELGTQLELVHVVEPISNPPWLEMDADRKNLQRQRRASRSAHPAAGRAQRCGDRRPRRDWNAGRRNREDRREQTRRPRSDDPAAGTRVVRPASGIHQLPGALQSQHAGAGAPQRQDMDAACHQEAQMRRRLRLVNGLVRDRRTEPRRGTGAGGARPSVGHGTDRAGIPSPERCVSARPAGSDRGEREAESRSRRQRPHCADRKLPPLPSRHDAAPPREVVTFPGLRRCARRAH